MDGGFDSEEFHTPIVHENGGAVREAHAGPDGQAQSPSTPKELFRDGDSPRPEPIRNRKERIMSSPRAKTMSKNFNQLEPGFEDGYDSDGAIGPLFDAVDDEADVEEPALGEDPSNDNGTANEAEGAPAFVDIPPETVKKMKVAQLREELRIRNKTQNGSKGDLVDRLLQALADRAEVVHSRRKKDDDKGLKGFPQGAKWVLVSPDEAPVEEPDNGSFLDPRGPTDNDTYPTVQTKHNFSECFDVPMFTGKSLTDKAPRRRGVASLPTNDEYLIRKKGEASAAVTLDHTSHPAEFLEIFIPFDKNPDNTEHMVYPSIASWTNWTNTKAIMAGANDQIYKNEYKPFTRRELRQHLGLYVLQGVSPTPTIETKFQSQSIDPVGGNDMVYRTMGRKGIRRHRHFKAFFGAQDPIKPIPCRKTKPNWKVEPCIKWINKIGPKVWRPGPHVSADEQTIGFKGKHKDKKRITYKRAGDGFQTEALCDRGFTYQVYFRNEAAPNIYKRQGLSSTHARVAHMFRILQDKWHRVGMDNLYNSAKFCRFAYVECKTLVHGVTRPEGRGVPRMVIQKAADKEKDAGKLRGTAKLAKLVGDDECKCLIATSVYDTKPVHFLTTCAEKVKWIEKERPCYNVDTGAVEPLKFLRLNVNDQYNNGMNSVDISDQLREVYKFNRWLRMRKWWWSIVIWFLGVSVVNAYEIYKSKCSAAGVKPMSHYEFQKTIAMAWIDPENYGPPPKTPAASTPGQRQTRSSASSTASRKRREYISLSTFDKPDHTRLDQSRQHFHSKLTKPYPCKLHRLWNRYTVADVYECKECKTPLCIECWGPFHNILSSEDMEEDLARRFGPKDQKTSTVTKAKRKRAKASLSPEDEAYLNKSRAKKKSR